MSRSHRFLFVILLLAAVVRLYHITFPVAGYHDWRQADTASIARNFHQSDYNILYPQIDWGGNTPGYVETEFQIYPFIVSLLYGLFGEADFWGRLVSLLFSMFTIIGLFLVTREVHSQRLALAAAAVYAFLPLNIYYGRTFMPESMMLMGTVYTVYYYLRWMDTERLGYAILSGLALALAASIKPPALYIGLPLIYLSHARYGWGFLKRGSIWLYAVLALAPVGLWYWHAHSIKAATGLTFGIWEFGEDKWGNTGLLLSPDFYNTVFFKSIAERHLTWAGFIIFIAGLFVKRSAPRERLFDWWILGVVVYFFIVARGNYVHEYYQLPIALPAAVFLAKVLSRYLTREQLTSFKPAAIALAVLLVAAVGLGAARYTLIYMQAETRDTSIFKLADAIKRRTNPDDLIIAVNGNNPHIFYISERKGWNANADSVTTEFIAERKAEGARYVASITAAFDTPERQKLLDELVRNNQIAARTDEYILIAL